MQTQLKNQSYVRERLNFFLGYSTKKTPKNATIKDWYIAVCNMLNDELVDMADITEHNILNGKNKMMAYMSMEYLMGKLSKQSMLNLGMWNTLKKVLAEHKVDIEKVISLEPSTQLGNGGLGRLAACFFDSLATLKYPAFGYGLFYRCGIYRQEIKNGVQVEKPDLWIEKINPAVDRRNDIKYNVAFGGTITEAGRIEDIVWTPQETVSATANDVMIAGYENETVLRVRLWEAERYDKSAPDLGKNITNITDFLYPPDSTDEGRRLRLRQEYLLVSASVQDLFDKFAKTKLPATMMENF